MAGRILLLVVAVSLGTSAIALAAAPLTGADMTNIRRDARLRAQKLMVIVDASSVRVSCFKSKRSEALCRLRMINATSSDGDNYDCTEWLRYYVKGAYIRAKLANDFCTR